MYCTLSAFAARNRCHFRRISFSAFVISCIFFGSFSDLTEITYPSGVSCIMPANSFLYSLTDISSVRSLIPYCLANDANAVALEGALHDRLDAQRVNKVNRRKEFFYSSVDELESIVNEIDPTAEFNKTMMATEFRQSQSSDETYTDDYRSDVDFEDDDD